MNNERRSFVFVFVCIIFYLVYTYYLQTKYPNYKNNEIATEVASKVETKSDSVGTAKPAPEDVNSIVSAASAVNESVDILSADQLKVENADVVYEFDQQRSSLKSVTLKNYTAEANDKTKKEQLIDSQLVIQATANPAEKMGLAGFNASRSGNTINFWKQEGAWKLGQSFSFPEKGYGADVTFTWTNTSAHPADLMATILMQENPKKLEKSGSSFLPGMPSSRPMVIGISGESEIEREDIHNYCDKLVEGDKELAINVSSAPIKVLGIDKHYFVKALLPNSEKMGYSMGFAGQATEASCPLALVAWQPQGLVNPGQTVTIKTKAWFGPKDVVLMDEYAPSLSKTVDFGFFGIIAAPLLAAVRFCFNLTGNWGVAIILVTLMMKLLFYPLSKQAAVSAHKMKVLAPELKKLQEKFKDDRMALQQAMLKFYSEHKVNPMKGCLPMLPQLPVFFAFFQMLATAIELRHAPFVGWLTDLSAPDQYYVTPLLLGAAYFFQQKMTPAPGLDKTQQNIMLMMPVIFAVMMVTFPSGLVLYSLVNTIFTIAQQVWITRRLEKA